MSKGEKVFLWIASSVGVLVLLFVVANVCIAYYAQYNIKGVSSVISVYIDEERSREYLGKLDGYNIYTEQMRGEEMIVIDFFDNHIPLTEAMEKGLVSVRDWRRKDWDTEKDGDAEIYRYESYEIVIAYDDCIIRPLTSWDHLPYRDCSVGTFLHQQLPSQGVHQLRFAKTVAEGHETYLKKMGYVPAESGWVLQL